MSAIRTKKTIIGAKVSSEEKQRILGRCTGLNCTASDYIKRLIGKDMARAKDNVIRIRVEADKIIIPCPDCGGPIPFNLSDLGLRHI